MGSSRILIAGSCSYLCKVPLTIALGWCGARRPPIARRRLYLLTLPHTPSESGEEAVKLGKNLWLVSPLVILVAVGPGAASIPMQQTPAAGPVSGCVA